jgi:hypothetical protein
MRSVFGPFTKIYNTTMSLNKIEEWIVNKLADVGKQILTQILMELLSFVKYAASKMVQKLSELFVKYLN